MFSLKNIFAHVATKLFENAARKTGKFSDKPSFHSIIQISDPFRAATH